MRTSLWLLAVSLSGCALTEFPADPDGDGVIGANDCDPADGSITKLVVWPDTDGDGFGAGEPTTVDDCQVPAGSAANDDDCDDTDAEVGDHVTTWPDLDGDGFGSGQATEQPGCDAPAETATNDGDCDDADASVEDSVRIYEDLDGDGLGDAYLRDAYDCVAGDQESLVTGDCDDSDATIRDHQLGWVDADGDGYGEGDPIALPGCDTTGYAVFGGDCFPNDASLPLAHDLCYTTADEDCSAAVAVCNLRGVGVPPVTVNRGTTYGLTPRFPTRDGDFDGDGVDDVFVGMQQVQIPTLPDFGLLLYGEAGVPVESWTTQSGVDVSTGMGQHGWTRGVFLDYDGNGQDDLAFLDFDPFSGEELLLWFLQGGSRLPVSTTVEGNVTAGRIHFSAPEASWELKGYDIIAGDLTGPGGLPDGRDDLVVTAPDADAVAGQHDTVYVIEGGGLSFATGASVTFGHASVQRISEPQAPTYYPFDDQLGVDASYVPDIDGAGTPALSLMTMGANDGTEVRVLSGPLLRDGAVTTDITLFNATSPSTGNVNNDAFPRSVWADLDRSGLPDLVFTAPDGTGSRSGSIAVVFDPVLDPAEVGILAIASTTIRSRTDNWEHSSCGEMVAVLPDLLGEESNALVIGCPETQNGGSVWVLDDATLAGGGQLFLEDDAWASIDAGQYNPTIHSLGNTHIVDGGDLDGDGLPDLMMSEGVGPALFHYASGGATYYTGP